MILNCQLHEVLNYLIQFKAHGYLQLYLNVAKDRNVPKTIEHFKLQYLLHARHTYTIFQLILVMLHII